MAASPVLAGANLLLFRSPVGLRGESTRSLRIEMAFYGWQLQGGYMNGNGDISSRFITRFSTALERCEPCIRIPKGPSCLERAKACCASTAALGASLQQKTVWQLMMCESLFKAAREMSGSGVTVGLQASTMGSLSTGPRQTA